MATTVGLCAVGRRHRPAGRRRTPPVAARPPRQRLTFADGTTSFVFRETAIRVPTADPAVLVVRFRLRLVGTAPGWHRLFRRESVLHTPLFAGFAGFRSKLWLSDLQTGVFRGLYEWDGAELASAYAETLARLLRIVSVPGSVDHHVVRGVRRDDVLGDPASLSGGRSWWRPVAVDDSPTRVAWSR